MAIYERLCSAVSSLGTRAHIVNSDADASSVNTDNCILVIVCAWSAPSWMVLNLIVHILALPGNDDTDLYVMDCEKWNSLDIWREIGEEGEYMGVPQSPGWGEFACIRNGEIIGKGKWDHTIKGKPGLDRKMLMELIDMLNKPGPDTDTNGAWP